MSFETGAAGAAIRACAVTKLYRIYERPEDRLKQLLRPRGGPFYREFPAVREVDLEVWRGETMAVVGRNGSGKSTLLRMIGGILAPTAGTLHVDGVVAPILTLGAGFDPDFTGRENVLTHAAVLGMSPADVEARLDAIVAFADIGTFFDEPVRSYSAGMHARLAFAIAIHTDPDVLIVDEILAVGDEAFTRKCFARIEELKARGMTILFASHSASLVLDLADRAVLLEEGRRLLVGDPKRVISCYHRLVHAPPEERPGLVRAICEEDATGVPSEEAPWRAETPRPVAESPPEEGRYDPELRPEGRVVYPERGARILEPRILDASSRSVNVLRPERDYVYRYEVEFLEPCFAVRFAMLLMLVTGFELYGRISHPPGKGLEGVGAGTRIEVRFPFRTRLVPGTYFLNAGVHGMQGGDEIYLHRIVDAMMLRVEPEGPTLLTGRVDLGVGSGCDVRVLEGG
jgi:lipopolysaccharide transport system ATP-binding protein